MGNDPPESEADLFKRLVREAREKHFGQGDTNGTVNGAANGAAKKAGRRKATEVEHGDDDFPLTDVGNARRLVQRHGIDLRHCWTWGSWIIFDGRRWAIDNSGEIYARAKDTVGAMAVEAGEKIASLTKELAGVADGEPRRRLEAKIERQRKIVSWAFRSQHRSRIEAMIALARSERGIPVQTDDLDRDRYLLNCPNGTVELKTGTLRENRRSDLITKLCPTEYHPTAEAPVWHRCLRDVHEDDGAVIDYVRRHAGYSLTGDVSEQQILIAFGSGANGKTTQFNAILDTLGPDYAMRAASEMLLAKKNQGHPTERADLFGKRLVVCSETDDGRQMAEAMIKDLTGGEKVRARFLYQDNFEFDPTHKIVLLTNYKPKVKGRDRGIWRRIQLLPFNATFEGDRRDSRLPDKLAGEREGILAWMVGGCVDWCRTGLNVPDSVRAATDEYRAAQDQIGAFIRECCLTGADYKIRASDFLTAYQSWSGDQELTQRALGERIEEMGFQKKTSNGVWYLGVALKS